MWILGFIGLIMFFENFKLSLRIGTTASLMMAYITHLGNIRKELPQVSHTSLIYWLIYGSILVNILCLVESLMHLNDSN